MPAYRWISSAMMLATIMTSHSTPAYAEDKVARGRYLVQFGGCNDCHTPGYLLGNADHSRYLGGSDVGFQTPAGTVVGPNLTPDKETGLGTWTDDQIVHAIQSGVTPEGRVLSPLMPWPAFSKLTTADVHAIVAFLRTLPPVKHEVPKPFGPNETPTVTVLKLVPYKGPAMSSSSMKGGTQY
jgi:mono/diheme cytochrome c family protein